LAFTGVGVRVPPLVHEYQLQNNPVQKNSFANSLGETVDINIQELTAVDKEVIIKANREDLEPNFEKAYKKYRSQINMPGFRPGKVPVGIIKKRFGKEIEAEEINKYVQEVFEKEVVPEHEPIGESQMTDLQWEDDKLEAKFKIGAKPEFELVDLNKITVKKLVHDVTDEEVDEEINRTLQRKETGSRCNR